MLIDAIKNILETAQRAHNEAIKNKPNKFLPLNIESTAFIERLEFLLAQNYDESRLASEIETLLSTHWALVRNSCLSYTALPDHYLTQCCVSLAKALHTHDSTKTDLNYLMPGVTKLWQPAMVSLRNNTLIVIESKENDEDITDIELNDAPLDQIIFSADGNKIIPINSLRQLPYHSLHWHMQHDPDLQSQDTLERLKNHSKEERYWLDAYHELETAHNSNITLKDALQQLAADLKEGAIYAEGEETSAGTTAFVGVARFMRIFNRLSLEQQTSLLQLNDDQLEVYGQYNSLKNIIHNLTKGGSKSDTCVHDLYLKIERILNDNSNNEFLNTKTTFDIEVASNNFSKFKIKSPRSIESGSDKLSNYPIELIQKIANSKIHSSNDLSDFLSEISISLNSTPLSISINLFKNLIVEHIKNNQDLFNYNDIKIKEIIYNVLFIEKPQLLTALKFAHNFQYVTETNRLLFLEKHQNIWINHLSNISEKDFSSLITNLSIVEIKIIFDQYIRCHNINNFKTKSLHDFLKKLPDSYREFVFNNYIKNRAKELISSSEDLLNLLPYLNTEQRTFIFEENKEKFSNFIANKEKDFFSNLKYFNEQQRIELFEIFFKNRVNLSVSNLKCLLEYLPIQEYPKLLNSSFNSNLNTILEDWNWSSIFYNLSEEKLKLFVTLANGLNNNFIKQSMGFFLQSFPEDKCRWFLSAIEDKLPSIITSLDDLKKILQDTKANNVDLLFKALGNYLFSLVPNYQSFSQITSVFCDSEAYYFSCCDAFKERFEGTEQLKELFKIKLYFNHAHGYYLDKIFYNRIAKLDDNSNLEAFENDVKICRNIFNFTCKFTPNNSLQDTIVSMEKFRIIAFKAVLQNDKPYPILEKKLKKLAKESFEHKDYGKRVTADVLQFITGLFIFIIPVKWCLGQSAFFSHDKTNRQKKFEKDVLHTSTVPIVR